MVWEKIEHGDVGTLDDRTFLYGLLARLYRTEIDEQLLEELRDTTFPCATPSNDMNDGSRLINGYLKEGGTNKRQELAVDFARLFILRERYDKRVPYPFESAYTSQIPTMMGEARDKVFEIYRAFGLKANATSHLPEDHIALELEFLCILSREAKDAVANNGQAVAEELFAQHYSFLQEHVLNWIGFFVDAVEQTAHTDFYQGLAMFTRGFLETDERFLEAVSKKERVKAV